MTKNRQDSFSMRIAEDIISSSSPLTYLEEMEAKRIYVTTRSVQKVKNRLKKSVINMPRDNIYHMAAYLAEHTRNAMSAIMDLKDIPPLKFQHVNNIQNIQQILDLIEWSIEIPDPTLCVYKLAEANTKATTITCLLRLN